MKIIEHFFFINCIYLISICFINFFVLHRRIVSAVKRGEWVSDRMSYIVLRGCWSDIALNVHTPTG
jgi:hypothetical protein